MKKNLSLLAIALLLSISFVWAQTRETRTVDTFTEINFRMPGKVHLRQGNTQKVELEGSADLLKVTETEVEGSRLTIAKEGSWRDWKWSDNDKITVYITVKNLEGVSVSGSGAVIGETTFNTGSVELKVSGSGSLELEIESSGDVEADVSGSGHLNVKGRSQSVDSDVSGSGRVNLAMNVSNQADFSISGSGKIEASGKASHVKASISGSGKVFGADLETNRCEVRISGSGNVEINVKDELDAVISGSGSVSYKGNPSKVNSASSGSGRVSKM